MGKSFSPADLIAHYEARDHGLTVAAWAKLLAELNPKAYVRPEADQPTATLPGTPGRVAIYRRRRRDGKAIFHSGDLAAVCDRLEKRAVISKGNFKCIGTLLSLGKKHV